MKKIILLALFAFSSALQAQIVSIQGNGEEITEGQTFTYNSITERVAKLNLLVTNLSDTTINLKLKANSISEPSDFNLQFCFGDECYFNIVNGSTVPSQLTGKVLQPGESNNDADHFWNLNEGNGTDPVTYSLSVIQVDDNGAEIAVLRTFTYVYSATAGTTDFSALKNMGITVKNTVVTNQFEVSANQNAALQLVNINGQVVKTAAIKNGTQVIDLSGVASAVYFARFTTEQNKTAQIKVVKK